jgi:hypothetical protein
MGEEMTLPLKLFAGGAIALGLLIASHASQAYWQIHQAQGWVEAEAIVLSSSVRSWASSKGGTSAVPCLTYTYAVGNVTYKGSTVRFGPAVVDLGEASDLIKRFPTGATTVAYVDPQDHQSAVLDRNNPSSASKWKLGCGLFLAAAGMVLLIAANRVR